MQIEKQVCSLSLAKELKQNGYPQTEGVWWWAWKEEHYCLTEKVLEGEPTLVAGFPPYDFPYTGIVAPTVSELGERLPDGYRTLKINNIWMALSPNKVVPIKWAEANTEANARCKMLLYLVKEGLIKW